ncbi:MAG: peptide chain release factor N(5)-glutamine methyltransferase [Synechococcaceae cyanobacterium]|nr:peptide chain release factor N(5)-glutamine methyltransferase [Synechococcaceae cyanobacterium]
MAPASLPSLAAVPPRGPEQPPAADGNPGDPPCGDPPCGNPPNGEAISGEGLLAWRRSMLSLQGAGRSRTAELDWLLDLGAGVRWPDLQRLRLRPETPLILHRPLSSLEELWRRHCSSSEPLQYLLGCCCWSELRLAVGPAVLIPRPETERLAELAVALAPAPPAERPLRWADLGTGSGCLAIALESNLDGAQGLAVDRCAAALAQAAVNLSALAPAVGLRQGDWWQAIEPWWGQLDLVVSNPPYIPTTLLDELDPEVRDHEPRLALDGGADGLEAIRTLISGARQGLAPGGVLVLEHHHDQSDAVLQLLAAAGLDTIQAHRDLEGVLRFASGSRHRDDG